MRWPWEEPVTADTPDIGRLTEEEAIDLMFDVGRAVLPETGVALEQRAERAANLVAPELARKGYHLVGPKPIPRRNAGLKLEAG